MRRTTAAVLLLCAIGSACAGSSEVTGDRRVVGSTTVTFTARPARVEVGKNVQLAIRLTNNGGRKHRLTFPSAQQYDFWVTKGTREIWRWSKDKLFTQAVTDLDLGPQESRTLAEMWVPTAAGTFVVHGELHADGYRHELTGEVIVGG